MNANIIIYLISAIIINLFLFLFFSCLSFFIKLVEKVGSVKRSMFFYTLIFGVGLVLFPVEAFVIMFSNVEFKKNNVVNKITKSFKLFFSIFTNMDIFTTVVSDLVVKIINKEMKSYGDGVEKSVKKYVMAVS